MSIDLRKAAEEKLIDLSKKAAISLTKKGLSGEIARVGLALDISASMTQQYKTGSVQRVTERCLALAMNFDDNGAADVFVFGQNNYTIGEIAKENFYDFVNREIYKKRSLEGGTNYAGVMLRIIEHYFPDAVTYKKSGFLGTKRELIVDSSKYRKQEPVYIIFVTDGNCGDSNESTEVITKASELGVFFQFVGIGNERFKYLKELDNLGGRFIDNANFFQVKDIDKTSDDELYDKLLTEFPSWIKEARGKGVIR
jgi:hypothetical protein